MVYNSFDFRSEVAIMNLQEKTADIIERLLHGINDMSRSAELVTAAEALIKLYRGGNISTICKSPSCSKCPVRRVKRCS